VSSGSQNFTFSRKNPKKIPFFFLEALIIFWRGLIFFWDISRHEAAISKNRTDFRGVVLEIWFFEMPKFGRGRPRIQKMKNFKTLKDQEIWRKRYYRSIYGALGSKSDILLDDNFLFPLNIIENDQNTTWSWKLGLKNGLNSPSITTEKAFMSKRNINIGEEKLFLA